ncbi:MAG: hypothetical protein KA978_30555 [Deltaproteobacteria bacterium]|nr:hypothetical protein [Deltaproteobacteria bacterium]
MDVVVVVVVSLVGDGDGDGCCADEGLEAGSSTAYGSRVALEIRSATAFRWGPPRLVGQESDLVRVLEEGAVTVVLMANASEGGFSSCWPAGSRLLLDLFEAEWAGTCGEVAARLEEAFRGVARRFAETAPSLCPDAMWDAEDAPTGCLLVLVGTELGWQAAWIGGDVAVLVRRGEVVGATRPHTLLEHFRAESPDREVDPAIIPAVIARTIGLPGERNMTPSFAAFTWEPSDTLVVMNWSLHRGDAGAVQAAAKEAARSASPSALAERLVEQAWSRELLAYAAVAVLRLEGDA